VVRRVLLAAVLSAAPAEALAQSRIGAIIIPPLPLPERPAFRVDVTASPRLETVLDAVRRDLAAKPRAGADTPLLGVQRASGVDEPAVSYDVLPAMIGVVHRVQKARRERTERQIHAGVTAELAAFCGVNDCAAVNEGLLLAK
jgi:hypothetical protein